MYGRLVSDIFHACQVLISPQARGSTTTLLSVCCHLAAVRSFLLRKEKPVRACVGSTPKSFSTLAFVTSNIQYHHFWCDPVASMTLYPFLSLPLARVSGPNISTMTQRQKSANKLQTSEPAQQCWAQVLAEHHTVVTFGLTGENMKTSHWCDVWSHWYDLAGVH